MIDNIILSIAIPTWNRSTQLRRCLNLLVPQISQCIEIIVCDNNSDDDTSKIAGDYSQKINYYSHCRNIGPDNNILYCLSKSQGKYIWLLGDDDVISLKAVNSILKVLREYPSVSLVHLKSIPYHGNINEYYRVDDLSCVYTNKETFVQTIGEGITFISSIIILKESINLRQAYLFNKTRLTPMYLSLSAASYLDRVVIVNTPLVYSTTRSVSGYNAFIVFSKNIRQILFFAKKNLNYSEKSVCCIYNHCLESVLVYIIRSWEFSFLGLIVLILSSFKYKNFYRFTLIEIVKTLLKKAF